MTDYQKINGKIYRLEEVDSDFIIETINKNIANLQAQITDLNSQKTKINTEKSK